MTKIVQPVISIENFTMKFGDKTVIDDLSFEVKKGETFGFLGSNGSGKTTTMRALLGIYQPSAGSLTINGKEFEPEEHESSAATLSVHSAPKCGVYTQVADKCEVKVQKLIEKSINFKTISWKSLEELNEYPKFE